MLKILVYLRQRAAMLKWFFFGAAGAAVIFDCFAPRHGSHFWGDAINGFWALFAFFGCIAMIALFKGIYHLWLMKEPDYYD